MNSQSSQPRLYLHFIPILVGFLAMGVLVWATRSHTKPGAVDQRRVEERLKANRDLRQDAEAQLTRYNMADAKKGLVHLPISRSMEMLVQEFRTPQQLRSNLLARLSHFNPPPPPIPPQQPSEFE